VLTTGTSQINNTKSGGLELLVEFRLTEMQSFLITVTVNIPELACKLV